MSNTNRVMLIDDSKFMLTALSGILSPYFEVICFDKIKTAIEQIAELDPVLILLDVVMPEMSGFEALKLIKSRSDINKIPVIIMTAQNDNSEGDNEVRGFMLGAVDFINKPFKPQVVLARVRSHVDLYEFRRELEKTSVTDALTGIFNRRGFDEAFRREWGRSVREKTALSLCIIDIDCFKQFNDNYGHQEGDNALHIVGQTIKKTVKRATDVTARYGGEEFALILPDTDEEGAKTVAASVNQAIRDLAIPHEFSVAQKVLTVSIGTATTCAIPKSSDLIKAADEMLYKAKAEGRDRFYSITI